MRLIHDNSYALIYPVGKSGWKLEIYRIHNYLSRKIMGVELQKIYAFKQSAIRYAEKHLN